MKKYSLLIALLFLVLACNNSQTNQSNSGAVFGTYYQIKYFSEQDYQKQFDSLFHVINKSLSTYQVNSDISKINRNESVTVDYHFKTVFNTSKTLYNTTNGVFDPTIGTLVNAWDFGPENAIKQLDSLKIDSLMHFVGFNKVNLNNDGVIKQPETFLDFNAIAKGYAVDVIAQFLEQHAIKNYLVEIGGEIRTLGRNIEKQSDWKIAIENPNFDGSQSYDNVLSIKNEAIATSGTYRKFKTDSLGNRYAHIIDTKTGHPSKTNILSVSVIAENCMIADAYATTFQAMGVENTKRFLQNHKNLKVSLIFEDDQHQLQTVSLNGFPEN